MADFERRIIVVGAGIAGLTAALRMAEIGRPVTIVDPEVDPAAPIPMSTRHAMI